MGSGKIFQKGFCKPKCYKKYKKQILCDFVVKMNDIKTQICFDEMTNYSHDVIFVNSNQRFLTEMSHYKDFQIDNMVVIPEIVNAKNHKIILVDIPHQIDYNNDQNSKDLIINLVKSLNKANKICCSRIGVDNFFCQAKEQNFKLGVKCLIFAIQVVCKHQLYNNIEDIMLYTQDIRQLKFLKQEIQRRQQPFFESLLGEQFVIQLDVHNMCNSHRITSLVEPSSPQTTFKKRKYSFNHFESSLNETTISKSYNRQSQQINSSNDKYFNLKDETKRSTSDETDMFGSNKIIKTKDLSFSGKMSSNNILCKNNKSDLDLANFNLKQNDFQ